MKRLLQTAAVAASVLAAAGASHAADQIKLAHVYGKTGALEAYGKQLQTGLEMGFDYATKGTNKILGKQIVLIEKDTQLKPDNARALLAEAYSDDKAVLAIGDVHSGVALAMLPVAEEYEKIIIPEGVGDSITGKDWNRYVFRIGRNSYQDAASNAAAVAKPGVCISTIGQDYAFGRDGVAAYKAAATKLGARIVAEEYVAPDATDFTAPAQRLFDSLKDRSDCKGKYIFVIWAGKTSPLTKLKDLQPERYGIKLTSGGNILPALVAAKDFPGLEGAGYYYYEHPNNPVNDWLVQEHYKRFNSPPDFFTAQGMAEAMAITAALEKAKSTDTEKLIAAFEGLSFESPKGTMTIRKEDHQALQPMYHFRIAVEERNNWFPDGKPITVGVPVLVREIPASAMDIPITNKR